MYHRVRRRRRHRNARRFGRSFSYNRRHRSRRGRRRGRRSNPAVGGILRAPLAGYRVPVLMNAAVASLGFLGNAALRGFVAGIVPINALKSGMGQKLLGIGTAGLLGAGVGMLNKRWAGPVFVGAMTQAAVDILRPILPRAVGGTGWLGDYLTVGDAAGARPLGYLGNTGDYLTVGDAAGARPLGAYGDGAISEELASL